jgi:hypothetical protein
VVNITHQTIAHFSATLMSRTLGFYSKVASIWNNAHVTRLFKNSTFGIFFILAVVIGWINKLSLSISDMAWVKFQERVEQHACLLFCNLCLFGCAFN